MKTYIPEQCPDCGEQELRPVMIGNDRDGWSYTGDFECDSCGGSFNPFESHEEEDGCNTCDDYRDYIEQEVKALNSR